jgi:NAD(P)-dependent dehydrogenase (short-subunit alcohol dehydrogenase family)
MDRTFKGKRALVTGGGRGIGCEIVKLLTRLGAEVVVIDRIKEDMAALSDEIRCTAIQADLSDAAAARSAAEKALPIDLLVNCAGVVNLQSFLETTLENFDETINVNTRAGMIVAQVVARDMIRRGCKGAIVNISSVANARAFQDHTTYCISKGGVDQLTRCMALELGAYGIRTNAIAPVMTMTPMGKKAWSDPQKSKPMLEKIPLGRFNEPIDVANAVVLLLSDEAAMVNGSILPVDGGFLVKA